MGACKNSLCSTPDGLKDCGILASAIRSNFAPRGNRDSVFTSDRIINYNGNNYPGRFVDSADPSDHVLINSLTDAGVLVGRIDASSGTISLLPRRQ